MERARTNSLLPLIAVGFVGALPTSLPAVEISVDPPSGLADAPFQVRVHGLPPGSRVTLKLTRTDGAGASWISVGEYAADAGGDVDASSAASLGGSYLGQSPHGLLCSVLPVPPSELERFLSELPAHPDRTFTFKAPLEQSSIVVTASVDGQEVGSSSAQRKYADGAGETVIAVDGQVRGLYFAPPADAPRGAPILVVPGGDGGVYDHEAALLASHGHPSLALATFAYKGVSPNLRNYPIERIRDAARWLARKANTSRAVVMGISRGSEAAELAAAYFPDAFQAVIAVVPSHLAAGVALGPDTKDGESSWSLHGRPMPVVPFAPDQEAGERAAATPPGYSGTVEMLSIWNDPAVNAKYAIPVDRLTSPILILASGDDAMWPSWVSAARIRDRLQDHGKSELAEVHIYPHAGHPIFRVGRGGPAASFTYFPGMGFLAFGGLSNDTCEASFDSMQQILDFLRRRTKP